MNELVDLRQEIDEVIERYQRLMNLNYSVAISEDASVARRALGRIDYVVTEAIRRLEEALLADQMKVA